MADLHRNLSSLGTPLEGSGQQHWLDEHRVPVVIEHGDRVSVDEKRLLEGGASNVLMALVTPNQGASSKRTGDAPVPSARRDGAYVRQAFGYGLDEGVRLPPPDAQSTTADLTAKEFSDETQVEMLFPCEHGCIDFGETPYVPPDFVGTSALRFDPFLKEGYRSSEAFTQAEEYVREARATVRTDVDVNNGAYIEKGIPYTWIKPHTKSARVTTMHHHYAGTVAYQANGEHSYMDGGIDSEILTSSSGASTQFSSPNCAPFPLNGDSGKTYGETTPFSLEWQTICPQKSKVLQIQRTNGPGGTKKSAQVQTQGDGWELKPFEAWNGIFLNDGAYTWTVRASGESATQSGTFFIDRNNLCRPSINVLDIFTVGTSVAGIRVAISGCAPAGEYRISLFGTTVDGTSVRLDGVTVQKQSGSGNPIDLTVPYGVDVRARDMVVYLTRVSPYNGAVRVSSASLR